MSSIEENWEVSASLSGDITALIVKVQLGLNAKYGGKSIDTSKENWTLATEEEETIKLTLKPKGKIFVWQFKLGFGREPVLFCRDLKFDHSAEPPTQLPFPPMKPENSK
ncbi:hypothetical protein AAFF_G00083110 [Aldrovandia affinis]|uniref:Uncharacterized protein n=1 Tax=Aldrovandia affinis TaxID=143900 RepID=A0AAD7RZS0_9TELE|nr:hypothetical protein AAFF_G00083110 [Aldrovandia affinis]